MKTLLLEVHRLCKSFGDTPVLREVSFEVARGEIVCLLGPSGCGKTTLLNIIAGLERADSGQVLVEGVDVAGAPVHKRDFGLMFQDFALFPHKNVRDNVAFGLRMMQLSPREIEARVQETLALVGLAGFERRDVNRLSGGEQQRVALARSLAPRPRLLMLDEPLGSLDRTLRERLMNELRDILKRLGQTALYVTHDQEEAFAVADRIVIMGEGRVLQVGTPAQVYRQPVNANVARFLGMSNLLAGRVLSLAAQAVRVQTALGELEVAAGGLCQPGPGDEVVVLIRPEAAELIPSAPSSVNEFRAVLVRCSFRGRYHYAVVQVGGIELAFDLDVDSWPGETMSLRLRSEAMTCLPGTDH